jgi:hypothetical protein
LRLLAFLPRLAPFSGALPIKEYGDRWIGGKPFQLSDLPSEFADHPCNGRRGLSYLPKKVFRLVKDKDVHGITGVVGCFLYRQTVKSNLALPNRTSIQYDWEIEAHVHLL